MRNLGVVPQHDNAAHAEPLLRRFDAHVKIVPRKSKCFAIK